jgi:hypothetical protein
MITGLWFTREQCPANARCAFIEPLWVGRSGWVVAALADGRVVYITVRTEPGKPLFVSDAVPLPRLTQGPWDDR